MESGKLVRLFSTKVILLVPPKQSVSAGEDKTREIKLDVSDSNRPIFE